MSSFACPIAFCMVISENEPTISCYGPCQSKFHAICLGISEVCIEKFRDPTSGYKYVCVNCRDISITSISKEFKRMEMNFKALRSKFLSFEKSSSKNNVKVSDNSSQLGLPVKRSAIDMDELTVSAAKKISTPSSSRVQEVAFVDNIVDIIPPTSLELALSATSVSNNAAPTLALASVPSPCPIAAIGLTAVPKPKSLFVSRLNPQATVEQVINYISLKFEGCDIIKVKKLTNNRRPVSSFKIDVSDDLLNSLLQKEIWPEGAFVNIFEDRSRGKLDYLTLYYQNVRGLRTKTSSF